MVEKKRPVGRPNTYKDEYCEFVVELGRQGCSPMEIAAELGVCRATLHSWRDSHPEFLAALRTAKAFEQAWWEKTGRNALYADKFQANVWHKSMQARFREDYTERKEITGADGGAVKIESNVVDSRELDADQRAALRNILLAAKAKGSLDSSS